MKVAPISGDLLVKLSLTAAAVLVLVWAGRKAANAAAAPLSTLYGYGNALGIALNPMSPDNVVYGGISSLGQSITGNQNWTLGGAVYDAVNPNPLGLGGTATRPMDNTFNDPNGAAIY